MDSAECARLRNVHLSKLPYPTSGACIKPCKSHDKFKEVNICMHSENVFLSTFREY